MARVPGKKATRIAIFKYDSDPADEKQRDLQHEWMLSKMDRFRAVFGPRVRSLAINDEVESPNADDSVEEAAE